MAGIIKANGGGVQRGGPSDAAFNFDDLTTKAQSYLDQVRAEGAAIIAAAQQEAGQVKERAKIEGQLAAKEAAEKAALASLDQQLQTLLPALAAAVNGIGQAKEEWRERWERNAIGLAKAIAERVLRRELKDDFETPKQFLKEALELAAGAQQLKVELNPADHATLGEQASQIVSAVSRAGDVEIIASPTVSRGGCVVRTEFGEIDQQIETQLQRIQQELS